MKSRKRKQSFLGAVGLLACLCILTACGVAPEQPTVPVSLPTASLPYVAPIGDAALEYAAQTTLYLPRHDGARLISVVEQVPFSAARLEAESLVRALLAHPGDGLASALGGDIKLSLYGANPVEVSGNVATVNLAASALQLDRKALYLCGQAITNTLTELRNIHYVNLLVMDRQIGLDLNATLPYGSMARDMTGDIGAVYEQLASRRVLPDEDAAQKQLAATATLYYPLTAVNGVVSEARYLSFDSLKPDALALKLLQALADGPAGISGSTALPLLADLLMEPPRALEQPDGGGRIIELSFENTLYDMLTAMNVPLASLLDALCYTLTTFIPNTEGITVYIGGERQEHVMMGATEGILFADGVMQRSHFAPLLMDMASLSLPEADGAHLAVTLRPTNYYLRTQPRALLRELFAGPSPADSRQGLLPVIPAGTLTDADILGISLIDQTLVINLSHAFQTAGENLTPAQDRLLAYAIVNTLLSNVHAKTLCVYVGGQPAQGFGGEVDWRGLFYPNIGFSQ